MRKRAGFGLGRLMIFGAALAALALLPTTASAVTTVYHPDQDARTFKESKGNWTGSASYGPGCVAGVNCPAIANSFRSGGGVEGGGDGFIRTGLTGLTALLGATSTGTWTSPKFAYAGAGGAQPTSVGFTLATQANIGGLLDTGSSATYSVVLEDVTAGDSQSLIPVANVPTNPGWNGVVPVVIPPGDLMLGHEYRFRVSTIYSTVLAALPDARVDYDNVVMAAEAPGPGPGAGGGPAGGGLAGKSVVLQGSKMRVKVRCGRAVQGKCKIKLVGLWRKDGPRVTKLRTVRVRAGKRKKVALKVKPLALAALQTRDDIWVAIKVNANGFKTLEIEKLKLVKRG